MNALLPLFLIASFATVQPANILGMFTCPSKSHMVLVSALLKELVRRGHNVTLFGPYIYENPPENFTNVRINGIIEEYNSKLQIFNDPQRTIVFKIYSLIKVLHEVTKYVIRGEEFNALLTQTPKFDLIIQQWTLSEALLIMGHKHDAPTIPFGMVGADAYTGVLFNNPAPHAYVPNSYLPFTDDMSIIQRVINTIFCICSQILINGWFTGIQKRMLSEMYPDAPPLEELMDNIDIMFINTHVLSESPRPYLPNMIQIGGFNLHETEILPGDVKKFLDDSAEGVVYCNFGTNVNNLTLSPEVQNVIKKSLSKIQHNVLYKFDGDWMDKPKNIFTSKWLPQTAILAHHNVKVFITHGGIGGIHEGLYYGVPMLGLPFCLDQARNVGNIVRKNCGVKINPYDFTEDDFIQALEELLNNPVYTRNVKALSEIFQSARPMETAVHWVEHMLKYKNAKYLKSNGSSLPWYQYLLVDVFAFITLITIATLFIISLVIKYVYRAYKKVFVIVKEKTS